MKSDDYEFINSIRGGSVPTEYIPGVEKGLTLAKGIWCSCWFSLY